MYKKIFTSTFLKYTVFFVLLFFAFLLIEFREDSIGSSQKNLQSKLEDRVFYLKDYVDSKISTSDMIANSKDLYNFIHNKSEENSLNLKNMLLETHKSDTSISQIRIKDAEGNLIFDLHGDHTFKKHGDHSMNLKKLNTKNSISSFYQTFEEGSSSKFLALTISSIAFNQNQKKIGECEIEFDISKMLKIFSRTTLYDVYLVDSNGNIIFTQNERSGNKEVIKETKISNVFPSDIVNNILKLDRFSRENIISQKLDFLSTQNGIKIVLSSKDEFLNNRMRNNIVIAAFFIVVFLALLFYFKIIPRVSSKELLGAQEFDLLTNLPNRSRLLSDFADNPNISILIANIDNFKEINNVYGFKNGDELLKLFSKRLETLIELYTKKHQIKKGRLAVYKMSGDEFAIAISDPQTIDLKHLNDFCKYIHEGIEDVKYKNSEFSVDLKVTLGISNPQDVQPISEALLQADLAHKIAKNTGGDWVIYDNDLSIVNQYKRNLHWIGEIKRAIESDGVVAYYQPIYNVKTKKVDKYEALIRIINSSGNVSNPADFLELSKKVKLYHKISAIHARKVIDKILNTQDDISININVDDFSDSEYLFDLLQLVKLHNVGHKITLEIVESEQVKDKEGLAKFVELAHLFGAQVAIDDFGSGYSNFANFINSKVDFIKIDGSLIQNILEDKNSQRTVKAIIGLAKILDIKVVAEYVSSKEIFDHLIADYDFDYLQGFYVGKPSEDFLTHG